MGTETASVQRIQAAERLDVTAAAEIEEAEGADEDDGLEAVEDAEEEVVDEGEAQEGGTLPPPGRSESELPWPAAPPAVQLP
ncbi:hypothetical protein GW17_00049192, partial [Ensete ventricosum]